ncbi:hypothetical protein [Flavisolibacter ginsenosidimutans]|uniref:Lipoprotein n=1 Tax=Flavisolibacter ginsenosidimutans TaxID=661481 RepID=A0A5B8UIA1_9BACT|nr:hypothetical protein [Flavisolibacter ginsenosidimutans]QEC56268.1 hypothetical protein FSB75_10315 [Flavisolibacter ginsenosidimutans]
MYKTKRMTKTILHLLLFATALLLCTCSLAQTEPTAANWETSFIASVKECRLPAESQKSERQSEDAATNTSVQKAIDFATAFALILSQNFSLSNQQCHTLQAFILFEFVY